MPSPAIESEFKNGFLNETRYFLGSISFSAKSTDRRVLYAKGLFVYARSETCFNRRLQLFDGVLFIVQPDKISVFLKFQHI